LRGETGDFCFWVGFDTGEVEEVADNGEGGGTWWEVGTEFGDGEMVVDDVGDEKEERHEKIRGQGGNL